MNEIKINLNESIKVKLTDLGKEIYYHRFDDLNKLNGKEILTPNFPKVDKDGYTTFQLWDFMQMYGRYIGMTKPNVIKPLEIIYSTNEAEYVTENGMKEPTEKQIKYAEYLSKRVCEELPKEYTKKAYSDFISKWKPVVKHEDDVMNEPDEWQMQYS